MTDKNIYERILDISNEIGAFKKEGYNSFHKFKYAGIESIVAQLNPICIANRVCIIQSSRFLDPMRNENIDGNGVITVKTLERVEVTTIAVNVDNPTERIEVTSVGGGWDSTDKGSYKADSGARKYGIFKLLNLHAGDDDPEYHGEGAGTPSKRTTSPAKPRQASGGTSRPPAPPSGNAEDMRAMMFPNAEFPVKNDKGYDVRLITDATGKMAWAGKPASPAQVKAVLASLTSKGYVEPSDRKFAMNAIYTAFDVAEQDRLFNSKDFTTGYASFFLDAFKHMCHKSEVVVKPTSDVEPEPEPADDPTLDPEWDLSPDDDDEFWIDD